MEEVPGWWMGALTVVPRTVLWALAMRVGDWRRLAATRPTELVALGLDRELARAWERCAPQTTRGRAVTRADPTYPAGLAGDEQAPPVLLVEGDPTLLGAAGAIGVVGTRACTGRGAAFARELGHRVAAANRVVVSGLARGIDAAAHAGALAAGGGRTIAVLGHGLKHQSPRSNARLRERIVAEGGLVVAGWLDDVGPERWTFPKRNRWIAGLSSDVVVVEGDVRSGALITARDARELGRTVWAVPGPPGEPASAGPLSLLEDQGACDTHAQQVLRLRLADLLEAGDAVETASRTAARDALRPGAQGRVRLLGSIPSFLDEIGCQGSESEDWMERLLAGARVEEVARSLGWSAPALHAELVRRELAGELVRLSGGRYARACSHPTRSG